MKNRWESLCTKTAMLFSVAVWQGVANGQSPAIPAGELAQVIQRGLDDGTVVGAQSAVGLQGATVNLDAYGVLAPESSDPVDKQTLFCIGSCSKPFASACLLSLVDSGAIDLDTPIDRWLPEFGQLKLVDGTPSQRAPTLRELLTHHGGIYSQKQGPMTPEQTRAIRDFRLTLDESVSIISRQPLLAQPGTAFAYSGAGYCILGRVAEAATDQTFEEILQERLVTPLELSRTTFFPRPDESNIAAGGSRIRGRIVTQPRAPHLQGKKLALPLIGGSLHSTAEETAHFAQMILNRGMCQERAVISSQSWNDLTRQQFDGQAYGLGWTLQHEQGQIATMQHGGALFSGRSLIYLDVSQGTFVVVHWTLSEEGTPQERTFRQQLLEAARRVTAG